MEAPSELPSSPTSSQQAPELPRRPLCPSAPAMNHSHLTRRRPKPKLMGSLLLTPQLRPGSSSSDNGAWRLRPAPSQPIHVSQIQEQSRPSILMSPGSRLRPGRLRPTRPPLRLSRLLGLGLMPSWDLDFAQASSRLLLASPKEAPDSTPSPGFIPSASSSSRRARERALDLQIDPEKPDKDSSNSSKLRHLFSPFPSPSALGRAPSHLPASSLLADDFMRGLRTVLPGSP